MNCCSASSGQHFDELKAAALNTKELWMIYRF